MTKRQKRWRKAEKRIVRLLYRKGLILLPLDRLYWAAYKPERKPNRKSKSGYRLSRYYDEVYYDTTDYWGEVDEHPLVDRAQDELYWGGVDTVTWDGESFPPSTFNYLSRRGFENYLKTLPTMISDNKINRILSRITG